jgi:CheY-like chemotaxis protein
MPQRRLNVLLVEDDESAAALFRMVVERAGVDVRLQVARNGQEALDYLAGQGRYGDRIQCPVPDLLVLDLVLPGVSGFDVLDWRRQHDALRALPVVVFTGSLREADREKALAKGAAEFVTKPADFQSFKMAIRRILEYGLRKRSWSNSE